MLNILIADDDQNMCDCLFQLLDWRLLQCNEPKVVYNGGDAWQILQHGDIDLLITDVRMPIIEGGQLCRLIQEKGLKTQTVLISAFEDFSVAQRAIKYNVVNYIVKPIDWDALESIAKIVDRVLKEKESRDQYKKFFDEDYMQTVYAAMVYKDEQFLREMFKSLEMFGNSDILGICTNLLHILHRYRFLINRDETVGVNDGLMRKQSAHLLGLSSSQQRIDYVQECYKKEISFVQLETDSENLVRRIRKIVDENFSNVMCNVAWVADKMNLSPGYISKQFHKGTGKKLVRYIAECRVSAACRLLETTDASSKEISVRVGFLDFDYFLKVFRTEKGISPAEYRKRIRHQ